MSKVIAGLSCLLIALCLISVLIDAQELKPIKLPPPRTSGGLPLMQVLKDRKSQRAYSPQELSPQILSDLLWAAFGINRPEKGKRTAPSTMNFQAIDIYVALSSGLYLYDAGTHVLQPVLVEDIRSATGEQDFVKDAPVNLVYVADMAKMMMGDAPQELKDFYAAADTGFISQNVYLYCASQGLATVVRGMIDRPRLAKSMKLRKAQKIILAQSVGYPKNKKAPKGKKESRKK